MCRPAGAHFFLFRMLPRTPVLGFTMAHLRRWRGDACNPFYVVCRQGCALKRNTYMISVFSVSLCLCGENAVQMTNLLPFR